MIKKHLQCIFYFLCVFALSEVSSSHANPNQEIDKRKSAKPGLGVVPPIRIGEPPGYRKRSTHDVDDILRECVILIQEPIGMEEVP